MPQRLHRLALALLFTATAASAQAQVAPPTPAPAAAPAAPAAPAVPTGEELAKAVAEVRDVNQLLMVGAGLNNDGNWGDYLIVMRRVAELRPFAGNIQLEMAAAHAMLNDLTPAYDALVRLQSAGYAFDIAEDARFENLQGYELWDFLVQGFAANGSAGGKGKIAFTIDGKDLLVESIAWDPARSAFLAGSVRNGEVYVLNGAGERATLVSPDDADGLWGVFDLAVDAERDRLWVASAAIPHVKHAKAIDYGRAGIWQFELSTGKFIDKVVMDNREGQYLFSSIAVAPNGDVYVANSLAPQVFKREGKQLRPVVQNPRLTGIRGLTFSGDGKRLYFADPELGVFAMDTGTGRPLDMRTARNVTLFGIEELVWHGGALLAIQSGISPKRVVRLVMDAAGTTISAAQPLDVARPEWAAPTRGVVAGDKLYFVANSQRDQYDGFGIPRDAGKLEAVRVFESDPAQAINVQAEFKPRGSQ
jgi:hypothetical protein